MVLRADGIVADEDLNGLMFWHDLTHFPQYPPDTHDVEAFAGPVTLSDVEGFRKAARTYAVRARSGDIGAAVQADPLVMVDWEGVESAVPVTTRVEQMVEVYEAVPQRPRWSAPTLRRGRTGFKDPTDPSQQTMVSKRPRVGSDTDALQQRNRRSLGGGGRSWPLTDDENGDGTSQPTPAPDATVKPKGEDMVLKDSALAAPG